MGTRLSTIVTKTGDDGSTGLGDGSRVPKDHPRVVACGAVDELNSTLGVALTETLPPAVTECLTTIQHDLFDLGAELCIPGHRTLTAQHVDFLDRTLAPFNEALPNLKEFILPGGTRAAAQLHLARTVCRRAERSLVSLSQDEEVSPESLRYLNRLSDLLFIVARVANREVGVDDVLWERKTSN